MNTDDTREVALPPLLFMPETRMEWAGIRSVGNSWCEWILRKESEYSDVWVWAGKASYFRHTMPPKPELDQTMVDLWAQGLVPHFAFADWLREHWTDAPEQLLLDIARLSPDASSGV